MSVGALEIFPLITCIFILFAAIALLVTGIVFKRKGLWIPGAIILFLATVIGLIGLFLYFSLTNVGDHTDYRWNNDENYLEVQPQNEDTMIKMSPKTDSILKSNFSVPLIGNLTNNDDSQISVELYPNKFLSKQGIKITRIESSPNVDQKSGVRIEILLEKKFQGKLMLEAFDDDENELGNCVVKLDSESGKAIQYCDFYFSKNISIADFHYFTLTAFE